MPHAAPAPPEALTEEEAAAELAALAAEIAHHDRAYHQQDAPEITDAEYDALRRRNARDRGALPAADARRQPDRRVAGAPAAAGFAKSRHGAPMLSLGNAFAAEDFAEFARASAASSAWPRTQSCASWPSRRSTGSRST